MKFKLTIETRDQILKDNFDDWLKAYTTNDKKLIHKVQHNTVKIHSQKCSCVSKAVMNKLKTMYINLGLFTN